MFFLFVLYCIVYRGNNNNNALDVHCCVCCHLSHVGVFDV